MRPQSGTQATFPRRGDGARKNPGAWLMAMATRSKGAGGGWLATSSVLYPPSLTRLGEWKQWVWKQLCFESVLKGLVY